MFNEVTLIARIGKDLELKHTQAGSALLSLWVCTSKKFMNKNTGAKEEQVQWHTVICWNQLAENVAKYTKKGSQIFIKGELQYRDWEKDGIKHKAAEIIAHTIQFLGSAQSNQSPQQQQPSAQHTQPVPAPNPYATKNQYPPPQISEQQPQQVNTGYDMSLEEIPF